MPMQKTYSDSASATVPAAEDGQPWTQWSTLVGWWWLMGCRFANAMPRIPVAYPSENEFSIVFLGLRFAKGRIAWLLFLARNDLLNAICHHFGGGRIKLSTKIRMLHIVHMVLANNNDGYPWVSQNGTLNGQNDEKTLRRWDDNWPCFRATPPSPQTIPNMEPQFIAAATWHKAIFQPPNPSFSCQTSICLVLIEKNHPNWLMFFRGVDGVGIPPTSAFLCKEMQLLADAGRVAGCRWLQNSRAIAVEKMDATCGIESEIYMDPWDTAKTDTPW